jgi:hypothetical protein
MPISPDALSGDASDSARLWRRFVVGAPEASTPGRYLFLGGTPNLSLLGYAPQCLRRFGLMAVAVTEGLVVLLFVLSTVPAHWDGAPAGQAVVLPMPAVASPPETRAAAGPTFGPDAPIEQPGRPQGTSATMALQAKADQALPDKHAVLPPQSLEASERLAAAWQSRPHPVAGTSSATGLRSPMGGSPSRAQEFRSVLVQSSIMPVRPRRSSPQVGARPATLQPDSETLTFNEHWGPSAGDMRFLIHQVVDHGSPPHAQESDTMPGQPSRPSPQAGAKPATPHVASGVSRSDKQSVPPASGIRVFIHHVAGHQGDAALAQRLADYLRRQGFTVVDIRPVDFSISKPSVRYFFEDDRSASERLVEELGRFFEEETSLAPDHASDFTHYLPKPRPGNVEFWLPTS